MQYRSIIIIIICVYILLTGQVHGEAVVTGGWDVAVSGEGKTSGESDVLCSGSDPSLTLGIISTTSLNGKSSISDNKIGSQNINLNLAGYNLSLGYDGDVSSKLVLENEGSAAVKSSVGVTAAGISTGNESYDIFGSADLFTTGYLSGEGFGESSAEGSAYYDVVKTGTLSEVWGEVSGESRLMLEGRSPDALASTGGIQNGLHTDSRVRNTIDGEIGSTSVSQIVSYASVINDARANVNSSGTAQSGAWDLSFDGTKQSLANENVASSVTGELWGYAESNEENDFASVSSVLQSIAFKDLDLYVSGGPTGYAASDQSSSSERTYAETWVENATWGSVARENNSTMIIEWGNLSDLGSGAHVYEAGADAHSFGSVKMATGYFGNVSVGNMSLETYAEAANGTIAFAGTIIGPDGDGTMSSTDGLMQNEAGFAGGLFHFSYIEAAVPYAETHNVLGSAYVHSNGSEILNQSYLVNTSSDPNVAWSRTYGSYYQNHSGQVGESAEVTGGWDVVADGKMTDYGRSEIFCGGSPSIVLGITSTSSLDGPGNVSDNKTGNQSISMLLNGYNFSLGFDGNVSSNLTLESEGSAAATSFIGATASVFSIGNESYDMFGSADLSTDGHLCGEGFGESSADGSAYYDVIKIGTPTEVWGQISGRSYLRLEGGSPDALASTGGAPNGLHTDSRVTNVNGEIEASSTSQIISYASVTNDAGANVSSSGTAQGGAWDPSFDDTKQKLANENVASSVTGELLGYAEASGENDAADISSILQSNAFKNSELDLYVSGGPASYAASSQSSSSNGTYAETQVANVTWGSVARTEDETMMIEWGNLSDLVSKANVYEGGANSLTFGKILMKTDYFVQDDGQRRSTGNMSLDTYAETSKNKSSLVNTTIGPIGDGTMFSQDWAMFNNATFIGGHNGFALDHYSNITIDRNAEIYSAGTSNVLQKASVNAIPLGAENTTRTEQIKQFHHIDMTLDPNVAWAKTEGFYDQAH